MYEGITQQNLKKAVPSAQAFIFPTANLLGAWSFIFPSVVKSHQKTKNKQINQPKQTKTPKGKTKSFTSFLADLFSKYIFNLCVRVQVI